MKHTIDVDFEVLKDRNKKVLFLTVTDKNFFIGTLASVNSILQYHPEADIAIIDYNSGSPEGLNEHQKLLFSQKSNIKIYDRDYFNKENRVVGGWQYKTYAMADLMNEDNHDILIGIDSDCCIVSNLNDVIGKCLSDGKMRGGQDGTGPYYDKSYEPYGFEINVQNRKYMSTSLYFVPKNDINKLILDDSAIFTNSAVYGPQQDKKYAGHGDQGVLNATIYKHTKSENVELLTNEIWSMHWTYDQTIVVYENDRLINRTFKNEPMRSFHSPSMGKIWTKGYSEKDPINQQWIYAHFVNYALLGELCLATNDNIKNIINSSHYHLLEDLINNKDKIMVINKNFAQTWDKLSYDFINIIFENKSFHRMMVLLKNGSMGKYIDLVKSIPDNSRVLEIGSYRGGSILTLALATFHKNLDYNSLESFMGSENNTVDGWELPKVKDYLLQVKDAFPFLNIKSYKIQSVQGSKLFPDNYFDFIFVDGSHEAEPVFNDIINWMPKLKTNGIMAGDDISWQSVRDGLNKSNFKYSEGNDLWWLIKT
jgi:hypothetical protein